MSTRCYDTDLNDAAWAWIAPYLPAARSGGRPRTTDLRAVLAFFHFWRIFPVCLSFGPAFPQAIP
jgi:putative transposase